MLPGADADIREGELAGILFRRLDHLLRRRVRQGFCADQRVGNVEHDRDRDEVVEWIIGQVLVEAGIEYDVAQAADEQRIAVGRRVDGGLGADDGAGAGAVFHHHALPQPLAELVGQQPADDVVAAGRPDRHDDLDRTVGIVLRGGAAGGEPERRQRERERRQREWENGQQRAKGGARRHGDELRAGVVLSSS